MPHLKSTRARRNFIKREIKNASPRDVARIYGFTEKVTGYYKRKKK
jgi:predicted nucleotidyltransferase